MNPQEYILTLPLGAGRTIRVRATWPLTPEEWDRMLAILAAMKPGLLLAPDDNRTDAGAGQCEHTAEAAQDAPEGGGK